MRLILASASPRRLDLLARIGVVPDAVRPPTSTRACQGRAAARPCAAPGEREGARVAPRSSPTRWCLPPTRWSRSAGASCPRSRTRRRCARAWRCCPGRRHRVLTGVALAAPGAEAAQPPGRDDDRDEAPVGRGDRLLRRHGEWRGKAGGYALQGYGEVYVRHIAGSYSNVVGLPLAETRHLLKSAGYPLA
jgi:septum formation protein